MKKNILLIVITAIIFTGIGVFATIGYQADEIGYGTGTVKDAIDDLYTKVKPDMPTRFRYIKIVITSTKSTPAQGAMQIAELYFYNNQTRFTFPAGTRTSSTLTGNTNQDTSKLIDNNISTKYCAGAWGSSRNGYDAIKIDLGENNYIDIEAYNSYAFYTGDDAESRDPSTWYVYGSNDDTEYYLLDHKYDYKMPSGRNTSTEVWKLLPWDQYR